MKIYLKILIILGFLVVGGLLNYKSLIKLTVHLLWKFPLIPIQQLDISPALDAKIGSTSCDKSPWSHVYAPERLPIIRDCVSVVGTVDKVEIESDGDSHLLLRLDKDYEPLVNLFNKLLSRGDLIAEIICYRVGQDEEDEAVQACQNYSNQIIAPSLGSHVRVTGALVIDKSHGWSEVHPVSKIEEIR